MGQKRRCDDGTAIIMLLEHPVAMEDASLEKLLDWSSAELAAMSRFRNPCAKTSWCLARRLVRDTFREFCNIPDAHRHFEYGKYGKPYIANCSWHFNWSHADGCVALGIMAGTEIGVDILNTNMHVKEYLAIAEDMFSERETSWIGAEPGISSWERFLSIFTQKEAHLKADGYGLSAGLAGARATLTLPPHLGRGSGIFAVGEATRRFLAIDTRFDGCLNIIIERAEAGALA